MTSKFKCPFCGDNLRLHEDCIWGVFACSHPTCEKSANMYGTKELWAALIQAKQDLDFFIKEQVRAQTALIERTKELDKCQKDLEIARKALEELRGDKRLSPQTPWEIIADKALEQIEHKDKNNG